MKQCTRVELWVTGFHWVKFDTEREPVKKAILGNRRCSEPATVEAVSPEGFRFHWCIACSKDPICSGVIVKETG